MHIFPFHKLTQKKQRRKILPPKLFHPLTFRWLHHGLFAVICQLSFILLLADAYPFPLPVALANRFAPMLEHTAMSIAVLSVGTYLLERTLRES